MAKPISGMEFSKTLRGGKWLLAGNYCDSFYLYMKDGHALCWDCALKEHARIRCAAMNKDKYKDGWAPLGFDIAWEGPPEHCANCNASLPTVYGDLDSD